MRFFTFIGYNKETWWMIFYTKHWQRTQINFNLQQNSWRQIFQRCTDKGSSTIRPGFSAWWFLVAIGTWNSYWRHLNSFYSTRARWIHLTLTMVVVVELGGEENILFAPPSSWRRVHHITLEPGRACKKILQVLLQNIIVYSIQGVLSTDAPLKVLNVRLRSKSHQWNS